MFTAIVALCFLIFAFVALPLFITVIYKHFYDGHVNKGLQSQTPLKRWLAPLSLFILLVIVEFFLMIGVGMVYKVTNTNVSYGDWENDITYKCLTQAEIEETLMAGMDGGPVDGFALKDASGTDYECQIYVNENEDLLPAYVVRIHYTGEKAMGCWDVCTGFGDFDIAYMDDLPEDGILYLIYNSQAVQADALYLTLDLYEGSLESYDTGNLGTYEMPEPAVVVELNLKK